MIQEEPPEMIISEQKNPLRSPPIMSKRRNPLATNKRDPI